jgi:hypothetical protein
MCECRAALVLSFFARPSINGRHRPAPVLRRTLCAVRSVAHNQTSWSCYGLEASSSLLIALVSFFIHSRRSLLLPGTAQPRPSVRVAQAPALRRERGLQPRCTIWARVA